MAAHDAVVVGGGPAGLSAAAELSRRGDCLLIEEGAHHERRDRHADVLSGLGGAGLFSDGKHSFWPSASALWTLPDRVALAESFDRAAALLRRHGVEAAPWRPDAPAEPPRGAWHHKRYPSQYMPLAQRMALIAELAPPQRWLGARVLAAERDGDSIRLAVARDGVPTEVRTRALVVATGRLSPRWVRPWLERLGARFVFRRLEFGVRIEAGADACLFGQLDGVDPKLRFVEADGLTEYRTFCTCRDGEVVRGETRDLSAFSGRADGPPTGRSNLGLLVRTRDEALARAIEPALFAARPRALAFAEIDRAALVPSFGEPGADAVLRALARLLAWCPRWDDGARLFAPCIEGVGDYPADDGSLQVAPGVWVAGDLCGRFRGIVAGMISGRYAALRLIRASA
jgi:hypothetical protein